MKKDKIESGYKFGMLTVIREIEPKTFSSGCTKRQFLCSCECGNECVRYLQQLKRGHKLSCGCTIKQKHPKFIIPKSRITYRMENTRLYHIWCTMKQRCLNKNNSSYVRYGERGITICDEWMNFENFYLWATTNGYEDNLTLDRIDFNGNYCPENCRWVTWIQQENNKRNNRFLTVNGETRTISEWSRVSGIDKNTLRWRLENGWSVDKIFQPKRKLKQYEKRV